jgi:hypothetical protein
MKGASDLVQRTPVDRGDHFAIRQTGLSHQDIFSLGWHRITKGIQVVPVYELMITLVSPMAVQGRYRLQEPHHENRNISITCGFGHLRCFSLDWTVNGRRLGRGKREWYSLEESW